MVSDTNFIVRISGRKVNSYYIDYSGAYKITEIARITGLEPGFIREIYQGGGAVYDQEADVYYFSDIDAARKAIMEILRKIGSDARGKLVMLTEKEIEYIREALINEGAGTIHVKNSIKDAIFRKLNE